MFGDNSAQNTNDTTLTGSTKPINDGLMGLSSVPTVPEASQSGEDTSAPTSTPPADTASHDSNTAPVSASSAADSDLQNIKKEALVELSPLVKELDQNPEEKFETLMMMIQATDNKALIADAFETAKKISEDKKRAHALLDIINEINYFNHPNSN